MTHIPNNNSCLNCETEFPEGYDDTKEIFCSNCGQSNRESRPSLFKLLKDGISNIFNLDSRLVHTFRDIIYPAKLTRTYILGKRKYYVNPARLFIFMLIGLISLSLWLAKLDNTLFGGERIHSRAEQSTMLEKFDILVDTLDLNNKDLVSNAIRAKLFKNISKPESDTIGLSGGIQFFGTNIDIKSYGISSHDAVYLSIDEILTKYKVSDFWNRQYVSTYIRIVTNPANSLTYILKNLTWAILLTIILVSFFMKLLYIRRHYYIVEHAVLLLNLHSFFFVALSGVLLFNSFLYFVFAEHNGSLIIFISGLVFLFAGGVQFFAIKKYYNHGLFRTWLVQFLINSAYFFFFTISVFFVTLISVFLY